MQMKLDNEPHGRRLTWLVPLADFHCSLLTAHCLLIFVASASTFASDRQNCAPFTAAAFELSFDSDSADRTVASLAEHIANRRLTACSSSASLLIFDTSVESAAGAATIALNSSRSALLFCFSD